MAAEKYGREIVDDFMVRFESGEALKKSDPVYELRERLISSKSRISRMHIDVVVAIAIKAVRAYAAGKTIGVLRWSPAEEWPSFE